jgi:tetratricopeptide (TPR) repeat protein
MAEPPSKTFFSYARADSQFVLQLVKDLRVAGAAVWLDQFDIGAGAHWDTAVEKALRECPRQVIVLSPAAVNSDNVKDEVSFALEENKEVIPLLYRDCMIPFRLRRVEYIDFRGEYAAGIQVLLKALAVVPQSVTPEISDSCSEIPGKLTYHGTSQDSPAQPVRKAEHEKKTFAALVRKTSRLLESMLMVVREAVKLIAGMIIRWKSYWRFLALGAITLLALLMLFGRVVENRSEHKPPIQAKLGPNVVSGGIHGPDVKTTLDGHAQVFYERGKRYFEQKKYNSAINSFTQAIKLEPEQAEAYLDRGVAYSNKNQYGLAIQDFAEALKINPSFAEAYINRGKVYDYEGQYDRAIEDYNQALKIHPDDEMAYNYRGLAYGHKGEYEREIQDYDQALQINPNDVSAYINRGAAYDKIGKYDRAIEEYTRALKSDPNNAETYAGRGLVYEHKGDQNPLNEQMSYYNRAIEDFDHAMQLDPNIAAQDSRDRIVEKLAKMQP